MKSAIKYVVGKTYKPLLVRYLSKTRHYSYKGIELEVPPQVFHPGYFHSSKLLLKSISSLPLKGKTFLEPGAGSGLISLYVARHGAIVTATDINPVAVSTLQVNKMKNGVKMDVILSDLFENVPSKSFDIIAINPPYYKKDPVHPADYAWYCGEKGEYFERLFQSLSFYIHSESVVHMVLCDGCDLPMVFSLAKRFGFRMDCIMTRSTIIENNFIYKIEIAG